MRARIETVGLALVANAVFLLLTIVAGLFLSRVFSDQFSALSGYRIEIFVGAIAISCALGISIRRKVDRFRPRFDRRRPNHVVVTKLVKYHYLSRSQLRYSKTITIKALADGVTSYLDKYNWSGKGGLVISTMTPEHKIVELGTRNIWQIYQVIFPYALRKGDEITIAVRWDLEDSSHAARPFMSQTIDVPTALLKYELHLPAEFGVTQARSIIRQTIDLIDTVDTAPIESRDGVFEWEIRNPRLLHCYELQWFDQGLDKSPPNPVDVSNE